MIAEPRALIDSNVALGRAFFAEQDRLRGGPAAALCAANYEAIIGSNASWDRSGHEAFSVGFYAGFPDAMHHIEEVFATEDRVAVRFVIKGTHRGNFFGIAPTGRSIVARANVILHVVDGRVTRLIGVFDEAGLLRQIGALQLVRRGVTAFFTCA